MTFDFSKLKGNTNYIDKLTKEVEKMNTPQKGGDERFWQPTVDKAGNGMAVIRFLPTSPIDGEDNLPWARLWTHGFKGPTGKWYIENSLTTLNKSDPVTDLNNMLWKQGSYDENSPERKQARDQKRKLTYISNIYVISDPGNPDNEGKVFLFKYGKKIFDKITAAMKPEFSSDKPVNVFDLFAGANFKLRIRNVGGYRNFDQSSFDAPSALLDDEAKLEKIWKSEHSLIEFTSPSQFKSYAELKARLDDVLGESEPTMAPVARVSQAKPKAAPVTQVQESVYEVPFDVDVDDDEFKSFQALT